ncbi:MAG: LPS export ABC transporter permease LptG [Pseudomonadota bacterium]|nr:LPS export ABC transporter permease LptG [Pseudomonadota bacterium]
MTRIDRYIFRVVLGSSLVALLVLMGLETFFTLLTELEDVGKGAYGVNDVLHYLLLTFPSRIYLIFPMALLLGGLMGMGALAGSSELIAMRAAGVSILRLVLAALQAGVALSLVMALVGEYVAPRLERQAKEMRSAVQAKQITIRKGRGFWARDGNNFVQVRSILPGVKLGDIYIYELDDTFDLKSVTWAKGARFENGRWVLEGVSRSYMQPESVATDSVVRIAWTSLISPRLLEVLATEPEDLSMRDLRAYIGYLQANGLDTGSHELAFWSKVLGPLAHLTMLFVAMPFVFVSQRKAGAGQRLVIGIFLGLLFFLANRMLGNTVLLYGYPPLLGALLPTLLFFAIGAVGLSRMR